MQHFGVRSFHEPSVLRQFSGKGMHDYVRLQHPFFRAYIQLQRNYGIVVRNRTISVNTLLDTVHLFARNLTIRIRTWPEFQKLCSPFACPYGSTVIGIFKIGRKFFMCCVLYWISHLEKWLKGSKVISTMVVIPNTGSVVVLRNLDYTWLPNVIGFWRICDRPQ